MKHDGSVAIQHTSTVDPKTHELVYRYGRPYFWRESDAAMQWGENLPVIFETLHPFGLLVRPVEPNSISWEDVPMEKVRSLATRYSLIIFRGFRGVSKELYSQKARQMGEVQ